LQRERSNLKEDHVLRASGGHSGSPSAGTAPQADSTSLDVANLLSRACDGFAYNAAFCAEDVVIFA
jgi:hypothetical protein